MRVYGHSTSGSSADQRKFKLLALVDGIVELTAPDAELEKPGSVHLAAALHEEDSRGVVLWAILRPFLRKHMKSFPSQDQVPSDDEIEASLDAVLDESIFFLTQQLIKRHLRGEAPISLGQLAHFRYDRRSYRWVDFQRELSREIFPHARALQLWSVKIIDRKDKNGGGSIARYEISAGQALIDFDEFIFRPRRQMHYQRFYERYLHAKRNGNVRKMVSLGVFALVSGLVLFGILDFAWALDIGQVRI